ARQGAYPQSLDLVRFVALCQPSRRRRGLRPQRTALSCTTYLQGASMQRLLLSLGSWVLGAAAWSNAAAQASAPAAPPANAIRVGFICPFTGGSQAFDNST